MRGEDDVGSAFAGAADRITPACAGKTHLGRRCALSASDHPRMRGEDSLINVTQCVVVGSPPHARGRPSNVWRSPSCEGITPACAGKTDIGVNISYVRRDHPRMRGEDLLPPQGKRLQEGSPPHARGRRATTSVYVRATWITPACAGKTPCLFLRG
mgnify:CR=1 FL=1